MPKAGKRRDYIEPKPFEAQYEGECGQCSFGVFPGEWCVYYLDELCHETCVNL